MTNTRITSLPVVRGALSASRTTASSRPRTPPAATSGKLPRPPLTSASRGAVAPERSTLSALTNHSYAHLLYLPTPWVSSQLDCPSVQCAQLCLHAQPPQAYARALSRA